MFRDRQSGSAEKQIYMKAFDQSLISVSLGNADGNTNSKRLTFDLYMYTVVHGPPLPPQTILINDFLTFETESYYTGWPETHYGNQAGLECTESCD